MSATDDVVEHIRGSLLDLRRRLDSDVVADIARAVRKGAEEALTEITDEDCSPIAGSDESVDRPRRSFFFRPN